MCMRVNAARFSINNTPGPGALLCVILPTISMETFQYMFTQQGSIKEHGSTTLDEDSHLKFCLN